MENQRKCTLCNQLKYFDQFNWDSRFNIPYSRCKPCFNALCKSYRETLQGKSTHRKWVKSSGGKEIRRKAMAKWRLNNKHKRAAQSKVSNAIRDGRLERKPCEVCNYNFAEAHHISYEEKDWLNVRWLCKKHHTEETFKSYLGSR